MEEKQATVPYFVHEGDMARMENAMNKMENVTNMMRRALIAVCITLAFVVATFAIAFTINNSNWIRYAETLMQGEEDGIHQQPNPGVDP